MSSGWLDRPQQTRLRKGLFQVHLWLGVALGLYIFVISISGSAVVFRREASLWLVPRSVTVAEARLATDELHAAILRQHPGFRIATVSEPGRPERPVHVALEHDDGRTKSRLVDPYTGDDIGSPFPPALAAMEWLVKLHDDLLAGAVGRKVNGVAGVLVTLLLLTGAVIWWPGRRRWRTSLLPIRGSPSAPRLSWQLHSVLGFWCFALLLVWAVTGFYFAFPQPIEGLIDRFDDDLNDFHRPGEALLLALVQLHFGRFGGMGIRVTWALLGLVPAVLFVTGFTMWWRRVVRRRLKASAARAAPPGTSPAQY